MNGYALTAAIVQAIASLAWPAAIFGSVFLFREQLTKMLPQLRGKYKDIEFDFRLSEAEAEVAQNAAEPPQVGVGSNEVVSEPSKFDRLAAISPRAAILEAKRELDFLLPALVDKFGGPPTYSMFAGMRYLRQKRVIDAGLFSLLERLRTMGNDVRHSHDEVSPDEALRYAELAEYARKLLDEAAVKATSELVPKPD